MPWAGYNGPIINGYYNYRDLIDVDKILLHFN